MLITVLFLCIFLMTTAFDYNIKYTGKGFLIFLDGILLAAIEKSSEDSWQAKVKISGQVYVITKPKKFSTPVSIQNMNAGEKSGFISVPLFPFFFRKSVFSREGRPPITWYSKNFYSFHWVWKRHDEILLEGVEDIMDGGRNGVLRATDYLDEPHLLIVAGIFLSIYRKQRGLLGLFPKRKDSLQV